LAGNSNPKRKMPAGGGGSGEHLIIDRFLLGGETGPTVRIMGGGYYPDRFNPTFIVVG